MISSLISRAACGTDPNWQTTIAAYDSANTDSQLAQWWAAQPQGSFANLLAKSFGDGPTNFECGIGFQSSCINAGCERKLHKLPYMESEQILNFQSIPKCQ
jgi:hypothetical protein